MPQQHAGGGAAPAASPQPTSMPAPNPSPMALDPSGESASPPSPATGFTPGQRLSQLQGVGANYPGMGAVMQRLGMSPLQSLFMSQMGSGMGIAPSAQ